MTVPLRRGAMREGERWSCVLGRDGHVHVLPEHDGSDGRHLLFDCWCCPRTEYVDPVTGRHVFVHHATDESN